MVATTSPPGRIVRLPSLAKYELIEELGHGGMATVYRAHDRRLDRDVAVKLLHAHLRNSAEVALRFAAEARAVAKLRHPNIVEVFDVSSEDDNEQFLVVELIRGPSLRKILEAHGPMPPEVAASLATEILTALIHAHDSDIVHRDVKPENVLIEHLPARAGTPGNSVRSVRSTEEPGQRVRVKLTDFGIAKLLDAQGVTSTGQVLGSPAHMAPEQIEGADVDERADVFGMGVLLYECLVGHLPFEGNNPAQVLRRVLDGLYAPAESERPIVGSVYSRILDRALAKDASDRYTSATAMRDALLAELSRLGQAEPRAVLEAWFDDPEGYGEAREAELVTRLCALGASARRQGDVLVAASDYNRALAYAPNDADLIRTVTGMHRIDARRRAARRVAPMVLVALATGGSAFGLTRALRPPAPGISPSAGVSLAPPPPSSATPSRSAPPPPMPVRSAARPLVVPARPMPSVDKRRSVVFSSVRPHQGVHLTVDGAPAQDPTTGGTLTLDDKPHELMFTCTQNMCEPHKHLVGPGDKLETLHIDLKIRDAELFIEGNPSRSYGISQRPGIPLRSGVVVRVPMTGGTELFDIVELETQRKVGVTLTSGGRRTATFPPGE